MNATQPSQPSVSRRSTTRWARFTALAAVMVLTSACPALALSVTYVTPRGNDANDCVTPVTPCKTINAALDKAVALGSPIEVRIAKGTYREFIDIGVTSVLELTLSGNWDTAFTTQSATTPTVLMPNTRQSGRVVLLNPGGPGANLTATLTNLTITGGYQTSRDGNLPGGGVAIFAVSPAIATVTLDHVTVTANRFSDTSSPWGGAGLGVLTFGTATVDVTVQDSVFSRNASRTRGGAIFLGQSAGGHITFTANRATFQGNTAQIAGGAVSAFTDLGTIDTKLSSCFVSGNTASKSGGGVAVTVHVGGTQSLTIEGCSFTANRAIADRGGAVRVDRVDGTFTTAIRNTIAWRNVAAVGAADVSFGPYVNFITCSIASSNVGELDGVGDLIGVCGNGGGNVIPAVDPMFVAPSGPDLHLKPTSPLRGLGNCALGPRDDIDGQSRTQGPGCDIGADEIP
jgi:hypothetical protein